MDVHAPMDLRIISSFRRTVQFHFCFTVRNPAFPDDYLVHQIHCEHSREQLLNSLNSADSAAEGSKYCKQWGYGFEIVQIVQLRLLTGATDAAKPTSANSAAEDPR